VPSRLQARWPAIADFTAGAGGGATSIPPTDALLDVLGLDQTERAQLRKIGARGGDLGPLTKMRTVGVNPAELFAVILMVRTPGIRSATI